MVKTDGALEDQLLTGILLVGRDTNTEAREFISHQSLSDNQEEF
jgi:hypothetical protein